MREFGIINNENGRDMQAWYVEKLGNAVRAAARLSKHIRKFGGMTYMITDTDKLDPYALNGCSNRIREDFEVLAIYLLAAYNYSFGYDKIRNDMSVHAELEMLEHNSLDPFAVDKEKAKWEEEHLREMQHNEEIAKKYGLCIEEDEESAAATARESEREQRIKAEQEAHPNVPLKDIEEVVDAEILAEKEPESQTLESEVQKITQKLIDALPDDSEQLKQIIALAETKLSSMGDSPNA